MASVNEQDKVKRGSPTTWAQYKAMIEWLNTDPSCCWCQVKETGCILTVSGFRKRSSPKWFFHLETRAWRISIPSISYKVQNNKKCVLRFYWM